MENSRKLPDIDPHFLYLIKNLRGILYFSPKVDPSKELNWLKKKFRYRDLGISETIKIEGAWQRLKILKKIVDNPALDSLYLASLYVAPLIILKEESLEEFEECIVASKKFTGTLSDRDIKFNIRLVNYAITDFYEKAIELALKQDFEGRSKLAIKDIKRYWRMEENKKGKTVIVYLDPLKLHPSIENPLLFSIVPAFILDL